GTSILATCLAVFLLARAAHAPEAARALTFTALVLAFLVVILVNRSWGRSFLAMVRVPNAAFRWVAGGTVALLAAVLFVPPVQHLFQFAPLHGDDLALSAGAGLVCVLWIEAIKKLRRSGTNLAV